MRVVIRGATQVLAHVPSLVRYGSKPSRERVEENAAFMAGLRTFEQAVHYAPHQAYIGALHPREMASRPWHHLAVGVPVPGLSPGVREANAAGALTPGVSPGFTSNGTWSRFAPDGEIMPEEEFLGFLAAVDTAGLITLEKDVAERAAAALAAHPVAGMVKRQPMTPQAWRSPTVCAPMSASRARRSATPATASAPSASVRRRSVRRARSSPV